MSKGVIIFLMCRYAMPGYVAFPLQNGEVIHENLKCYHCQLVMEDPVQSCVENVLTLSSTYQCNLSYSVS